MSEDDVKRAQQGNKESLSKIISENVTGLYRIAFAITGNEENSKDAIGNTTLKVCEKIKALKNPIFFKTWITRILINECNNIIKSKKKLTTIDNIEEMSTEDLSLEKFAVKDVINKLHKNYRDILILYYFNDFSIKEISIILNIAEGTVKSRLSRAREEFKMYYIEKEEV